MEGTRGRPNGIRRSQADIQLLEYLARVSVKYNVNSEKFFNSLVKVLQHRKSKCGDLTIECRSREQNHAVFLMTSGWKVVGQFRISEQLLSEKTNPLEQYASRHLDVKTLERGTKLRSYKARE